MSVSDRIPPAADRLDLDAYLPFYLTAIANKWTSTSSRTYLRLFGIGIVEWRILASLGARGSASSLDVVNLVGIDPASVSKSIRNLEARGLVTPVAGRFPGRTKPYEMTSAGVEVFDAIRALALERESILVSPLEPEERRQLLVLLEKVHSNLAKLAAIG